VNGYWSNTNNWSGGDAPYLFETKPVYLDFPAGVARTTVTNDIHFGFFGDLGVDSFIIGGNYRIYGKGGGTNIYLPGNPVAFSGSPIANINSLGNNVCFAIGLNLIFGNTNTLTNSAGCTLDIQSMMTGTGGWTFQGSGNLLFDGAFDYYSYYNNLTGTCAVQGGVVLLNRWDDFNGITTPPVNGPLIIGTTNTANSAVLFEYNANGDDGGQIGDGGWGTFPVTILPSGILENYGVEEGGISTLTMTGGLVILGSETFTYCPPDPFQECSAVTNYGYISATNITTCAPPSGAPSVIEGHEPGGATYDNNGNLIDPDSEGVFVFPSVQSGTNTPAIINVVSGTLNVCAPLFGACNITNIPALVKTGAGTLGLYGTNEYYANSIIQQGVVVAGGDQPFGGPIGGNGYDLPANNVVVANGAELVVSSPFDGPVPLVINGYGTNGNGAAMLVQNDGATIANVTLGSDSAIDVANPSAT
jgi:hypothetical protein